MKKQHSVSSVLMFLFLTALSLMAVYSMAVHADNSISKFCTGNTRFEQQVLSSVAQEYKLNEEQTRLLFSIRKQENGAKGSGKEMGVLNPSAMRYKGDYPNSLRLQAKYSAGTIKKRWNGSIEDFANVWCPKESDPEGNRNWIRNVTKFMKEN